eukprot:748495-Hanusia_phi.AAC.1
MDETDGLKTYASHVSSTLTGLFLNDQEWGMASGGGADSEDIWEELRTRIREKSAHLICIIDVAGRGEPASGGTKGQDTDLLERLYLFRWDGQSEDRTCLHVKTSERWSERAVEDPIRRRADETKAVVIVK